MEVLVYHSFTCPRVSVGERHCAQDFEAKNQGKFLYQLCTRPFEGLEEEEEDGKIGVLAIPRMSL